MAMTHNENPRVIARTVRTSPVFQPRTELAGAAGLGLCAIVLTGLVWPSVGWEAVVASLAMFGLASAIAAQRVHRSYPHDRLGFGNLTTMIRLVLTSVLVLPLLAGQDLSWAAFSIAVLALCLDGVDGRLARRQNLVSQFGARFDMEVDSLFGLVLAVNAGLAGGFGPFAILLGLPRYAFGAAALMYPWLRHDLPERRGRKAVCVLQLGTLIALQAPVLPTWLASILIVSTITGLAWSFGRDILWLRAARR